MQSPVLAGAAAAKAEPAPVIHVDTEVEVQRVFQQMKVPWSTRWLLGNGRGLFGSCFKITENETHRLLKMDVEAVLDILRNERQKRYRHRVQSIKIGLGLFLLAILLAKFAHIGYFLHNWVSYVGIMFSSVVVSRTEKAAALAIARFEDLRAIGPLAEALEFKEPQVRTIASRALIRLLPRMQASDAALLSPTQRACLNRALKGRNPELILAVLKAWEQVGDADAIDNVRALASGRMEGGQYQRIVAAASECLPFLRQNTERQQVGAHLLRPVAVSLTPSNDLLRPAPPDGLTAPTNQLLRPTDSA